MEYRIKRMTEHITHSGIKGMKWGYNDGVANGKRVAATVWQSHTGEDFIGYLKSTPLYGAGNRAIETLFRKGFSVTKELAQKGADYFKTHKAIQSLNVNALTKKK